MANDESVEKCCTSNDTVNNYRYEKKIFSKLCSVKNVLKLSLFFFLFSRCVLGDDPFKPDAMEISDECIPRKCVCDWDR